ncbi:MAG: hypothetical protein QM784_23125 [Polyangiaceae bacterium]
MAELHTLEEATRLVARGAPLLIAADARLLAALPRGPWIGGTTVYFLTKTGGKLDRDHLYVTELQPPLTSVAVRSYEETELAQIPAHYPEHGCSFIVLPAGSRAHLLFARDCANFPGLFHQPLVGWNAGVHLSEVDRVAPLVFDGTTGESFENRAVVMHGTLDPRFTARLEIHNPFTVGGGDVISFANDGFSVTDCAINGSPRNFAEYLLEHSVDTRWPLIADYGGAQVNVSFQGIDLTNRRVRFYSPVFAGVEYRLSEAHEDFARIFEANPVATPPAASFSCNCVLNFLYGHLEGKYTGQASGPVTFGEIAYIQLNQTQVFLNFEPCEAPPSSA